MEGKPTKALLMCKGVKHQQLDSDSFDFLVEIVKCESDYYI